MYIFGALLRFVGFVGMAASILIPGFTVFCIAAFLWIVGTAALRLEEDL